VKKLARQTQLSLAMTIDDISGHRVPDRGEVNSDLVRPSSLQF
jgi:hypothetical protein